MPIWTAVEGGPESSLFLDHGSSRGQFLDISCPQKIDIDDILMLGFNGKPPMHPQPENSTLIRPY